MQGGDRGRAAVGDAKGCGEMMKDKRDKRTTIGVAAHGFACTQQSDHLRARAQSTVSKHFNLASLLLPLLLLFSPLLLNTLFCSPLPTHSNLLPMASIQSIPTKPFEGQRPGTSGLRKRVKVFQQAHYTQNFIQATLDAIPTGAKGATLVVGGDGRYFSQDAVQMIIRIAAGNEASFPSALRIMMMSMPCQTASSGGRIRRLVALLLSFSPLVAISRTSDRQRSTIPPIVRSDHTWSLFPL